MSAIAGSAQQGRTRRRTRIDGWRWGGRIFLLFMLLYTALPMVWMLITSIKSGFAAMQFPPQWWPDQPTLASYQKLLDPQNSVGQDFLRFFWNSLYVSTATTILSVIVAVPAAYAFSRFKFPGRNFLFFSVLLRNMFPAVIFLVPLFIMMRCDRAGEHTWLAHPHLPDIRTAAGDLAAQGLLRQHPGAARAGGANRWGDAVPGIHPDRDAALDAGHHRHRDLLVHRRWNEYIYAYTFLNEERATDVARRHPALFLRVTTDFPGLMAASFMMSVPVVVLFLVLQRYFVSALTEGAVKH
jgi:multiple sugar transport system permease protein